MDAQFFIDFFSPIPDELWIVDRVGCGPEHCVLGHARDGDAVDALTEILQPLAAKAEDLIDHRNTGRRPQSVMVQINDGFHPKFQQATPKARILAALVAYLEEYGRNN